MEQKPIYPPADAARVQTQSQPYARVAAVVPDSPAWDMGFEPGCLVTSVDGQPVRDIIDWRWLSAEQCITVGYIDLDGDAGEVELWREPGEDWGFEFEGLVFDCVRQCRNACTFCFMRMLPEGMRSSLYLRDDDYRLSFLVGTFVTLTNVTPEDEARICNQRISPLRVSLQASNPNVRAKLIGKHAQHGLDVLDRLLAAGIEFHAQIVLVPGANDGKVLAETLEWAYGRPGILGVGIVPLGYTCHQDAFASSFNDSALSRSVLDLVEPFQERALAERGNAWAFPADEFYRNAYGADLLDSLPPTAYYGDYEMFEDGIGIIRATVDDWRQAERDGTIGAFAHLMRRRDGHVVMAVGCAQREFLDALVGQAGIGDVFIPLFVENAFFGGNVDVTGLLVGADIAAAIRSFHASFPTEAGFSSNIYAIPRVVFNDDGLTLDGMTLEDMEKEAGVPLSMVSCSPKQYFEEIIAITAN